MLCAFTGLQVRSAEAPLIAAGLGESLMQRAAHGLYAVAVRMLTGNRGGVYGRSAVILAGSGNNGADALYAGARLAARGMAVLAIDVAGKAHPEGLAALARSGGQTIRLTVGNTGELAAVCAGADLLVDGILGTGAAGGLREPAAGLISAVVHQFGPERKPRRPLVIACDLPSGVDVDTGLVHGPVLPADATVTFAAAKAGLLCGAGALAAGRLYVVDIGVQLTESPAVRRLEPADVAALLRRPRATDHKYTRGVLGIAAGSAQYPGAAVLATGAALAVGVGMVRYLGPNTVAALIRAAHPEVVCSQGGVAENRSQAWVVGPGAVDDQDQDSRARAAIASGLPVVVDAGALTELPATAGAQVILTPHAGELSDLLRQRGTHASREEIEANPARYAQLAARLTGATVLLKGHTTLVSAPTGELFSQANGTSWLATAGSGDTLAGILGALAATLAEDDDAARRAGVPAQALWAAVAAAAVLLHGQAGQRAARGGPLLVSSLPGHVRAVLADLLAEPPP